MFFVGIAGGSGSGKTTFAKKILQRVSSHTGAEAASDVALLKQDSYYLPSPPAHLKVHGEHIYDYRTNRRTDSTERVGPCKRLILEGIFTLWDADLRSLFDVKLFLNVEADVRFIRRLHRDVRERGRTLDSIIRQYYDTVRPMHHEFLEPTRQYADLVVGEETDIAAEVIAARLAQVGKVG